LGTLWARLWPCYLQSGKPYGFPYRSLNFLRDFISLIHGELIMVHFEPKEVLVILHLWRLSIEGKPTRFNELYRSVTSDSNSKVLKLRSRATFTEVLKGLIEKKVIVRKDDGFYTFSSRVKQLKLTRRVGEAKAKALKQLKKPVWNEAKLQAYLTLILSIYREKIRMNHREVEKLIQTLESSIKEDLESISKLEPYQKAILYSWINQKLIHTIFPILSETLTKW